MKEISILVAGFGGQGILFLGKLIAYGGMIQRKEITFFPAYGAEIRGGTANCTVIISDEMIGSPVVKSFDILIVMNEASLKRFQPRIKPDGLLIFNSSLIKHPETRTDIKAIGIPANELSAAQVRSSNMVMLGALLGAADILNTESAFAALKKMTPADRLKTIDENIDAIRKGIGYIEDKKSKNN